MDAANASLYFPVFFEREYICPAVVLKVAWFLLLSVAVVLLSRGV